MLHTRNCKHLHEYLNKDKFDVNRLWTMIQDEFKGDFELAKTELQNYFSHDIKSIREFFTLLDAKIAELYHLDDTSVSLFQR